MAVSAMQKKMIWMSVLFNPLFVAIGVTIIPFLFLSEMWQEMSQTIVRLRQMYAENNMELPNGLGTMTYNDFLMQGINEAVGQMPLRLALCYIILALPLAILAYLYSFIYKKYNSIILMVVVWTIIAAFASILFYQLFSVSSSQIMNHIMGRIIGLSLTLGVALGSLTVCLLLRKQLRNID